MTVKDRERADWIFPHVAKIRGTPNMAQRKALQFFYSRVFHRASFARAYRLAVKMRETT
ncbi:MAG: hypothetical protein WC551_10245 [Patescibacteria group bacterium]